MSQIFWRKRTKSGGKPPSPPHSSSSSESKDHQGSRSDPPFRITFPEVPHQNNPYVGWTGMGSIPPSEANMAHIHGLGANSDHGGMSINPTMHFGCTSWNESTSKCVQTKSIFWKKGC